jgi:hypothetical protein
LPLERRESALTPWFKRACERNYSIHGAHLEKAFHIVTYMGIANFSDGPDGSTDLRGDTTLFTEFYQV